MKKDFCFDGHMLGIIYEKGNFCIWNAEFLDWILSMLHMNFKSLISQILDELGDVIFCWILSKL